MSQTSSIKTLVIQSKDLIDLNKLKIEMNESIKNQINPEYIEDINIKDYFDTIGNGKVSDKNKPDYSRIFDRPNKPNYIDIGVSSTTSLTDPNILNENSPSEGYISIDKVLLPKGVELTLRDVLSGVENDYIVINEDFIITSGFDVYLDHVKQGKKIIKVKKRIRNLEKIKLSLF